MVIHGAVLLLEFIHLMAALRGEFRQLTVLVAAPGRHGHRHLFLLARLQLAPPQRAPLLLVGLDQLNHLLLGPRQRLGLLSRDFGRGGD
ncbi:hypothetical protein C1H46_010336 [Malus baccata]|uniref:Secreted protein n=1 Tax=Malus baccata TaxID=106549 RepID=A0A540MYU1_MALBA|nr:hypothetical protein C1H46_010336 [Malus baccata]